MADDADRTHYFATRPGPRRTREWGGRSAYRLSFITDGRVLLGRVDPGSRLLAEQMDLSGAEDMSTGAAGGAFIGVVAAKTGRNGRHGGHQRTRV